MVARAIGEAVGAQVQGAPQEITARPSPHHSDAPEETRRTPAISTDSAASITKHHTPKPRRNPGNPSFDPRNPWLVSFGVEYTRLTWGRVRSPTPTSPRGCARSRCFSTWTDVPFKPRAYEKAAQRDRGARRADRASSIAAGGVKALREHSRRRQEHRREDRRAARDRHACRTARSCTRKTPVDIAALTAVEGVGPKNVRKLLYDELGVRTLADLEAAARAGTIRGLPRFGEKSEEKILQAASRFSKQRSGRFPLGDVLPLMRDIEARLAELRGVERAAIAGLDPAPARRLSATPTSWSIAHERRAGHGASCAACRRSRTCHGSGDDQDDRCKLRDRAWSSTCASCRAASFGAALHYFTGSKDAQRRAAPASPSRRSSS